MAQRTTNLEFRRRTYYYRVSFTLNRKTFSIRLSLETADPVVARERASRLDLALKRQWRETMATATVMNDADRVSIMRAAANEARANLGVIAGDILTDAHDDPIGGQLEHQRSLRALERVVRDLCLHGLNRPFGSRVYEMHLLDNDPVADREELTRLREVIERGDTLAATLGEHADEALRIRNIDPTAPHRALAAREIAIGTLMSVREALATASDPAAALDALLASIDLPPAHVAYSGAGAPAAPAMTNDPARYAAHSVSLASQPAVSAPAGAAAAPAGSIPAMTIQAAAAAFLATHPRYDPGEASSWTPKTRSQFEAAIFLAQKHFGTTAVEAIEEMALADFVRTLRRLPSNHHKTPTHAVLALAEIAERGKGATLGTTTVNRHIRFIRSVLDWAWKRMAAPPIVDWTSFIEADHRLKRDKRPALTAAELETLFGGAAWHGSASMVRRMTPGTHLWWDAAYWVPVLLVYTGARREEMAKIAVVDIEQIEGIWVFRIRINEGGRVKNAAAERDVPIADAVLELGFLAFVERQRAEGHTLLFPELRRTTGTMGDVFYKKWWRAFERAGLVPAGKDIHSIRHYVSTALAAANISEERRADLLGHTMLSQTAGTYTKRTPLALLREVVNLLPRVTDGLTPKPT